VSLRSVCLLLAVILASATALAAQSQTPLDAAACPDEAAHIHRVETSPVDIYIGPGQPTIPDIAHRTTLHRGHPIPVVHPIRCTESRKAFDPAGAQSAAHTWQS